MGMKLFKHTLHITVNKVAELLSNKVNLYTNYIPAKMYKKAGTYVILEQTINEVVPVYKENIDYIICELRSTIQHESTHRSDELNWQKEDPEKRTSFSDITNPSKAEINPERAEENCIAPDVVTGQVENVSIYQLFEQAKAQANVPSSWKNDIVAATLPEGVAGQYLMKSMDPESAINAEQLSDGVYRYGNKLLIDVRKRVMPHVVSGGANKKSFPSNIQTKSDGAVTSDPDLSKSQTSTIPNVPTIPTIPSI
jgi:hypothetical protein